MSDEVRYVRLRPYDEKSGHTCRVYTHRFGGQFIRFSEAGVWSRVPKALADELEQARQIPTRPNSPPVFDVCTEEEARRYDAAAARERDAEKAVVEPSVDTAREVEVDHGPGRGDLSLEDVTGARTEALAATAAKAEPEAKPKAAAKPKPKSKPRSRKSPAGRRKK
jgi:hypothetical protein